jgi:hypothetical protein
MYMTSVEYLVELLETPLDQPPPKPSTYGDLVMETLAKIATGDDGLEIVNGQKPTLRMAGQLTL